MFEAWEEFDLKAPLRSLVETIESRLKVVKIKNLPSKCARIQNIDLILTKQLKNLI